MDPIVSVIIPHFNRAALLAKTVESVRASTFANYEIVIVDDGSDVGSRGEINRLVDKDLKILDRDGKKGPSRARNIGARAAKGQFLIFLDSDDLMAPWCLEQRLNAVNQFAANDLWVFPVLLFENEPGDRHTLWNEIGTSEKDPIRFIQSDAPWHTSSPVWRRDAFRDLGGFNEDIMYGDDSNLHLRAVMAGLSIERFPCAIPDAFVRRSNEDRITFTLTDHVAASRLVRLREQTALLRHRSRGDLLAVHEGQYFVEAEFLLFNAGRPGRLVNRVTEQWRADYPLSRYVSTASWYLRVALRTRNRAYVVLRLARRIMTKVLPAWFFPSGGLIGSAAASDAVMEVVAKRLKARTTREAYTSDE